MRLRSLRDVRANSENKALITFSPGLRQSTLGRAQCNRFQTVPHDHLIGPVWN